MNKDQTNELFDFLMAVIQEFDYIHYRQARLINKVSIQEARNVYPTADEHESRMREEQDELTARVMPRPRVVTKGEESDTRETDAQQN